MSLSFTFLPFLHFFLSFSPSFFCTETRRSVDCSSAGGFAEWSGVWDEVSDRDGFYSSPTGCSQSPGEQQPGLQSVRLQTSSGRQDRGGLQHTSEYFYHNATQHSQTLLNVFKEPMVVIIYLKAKAQLLSSLSNFYAINFI